MTETAPTETPERRKNIDQLLVDVFKATGQKLTADDPIVVAALFQSTLAKATAQQASDALATASQQATQALSKQAENIDASIQVAFQKLNEGAKKVTEVELASASSRFVRASTETLETIREQAVKSTPGYLSKRVLVVGATAFVVGASVAAAATMFLKPALSVEQLRLMHNGLLLDTAWPKLNKAARDAIQPPGQLGGQQPPTSVN
jgi:hypothetical protein